MLDKQYRVLVLLAHPSLHHSRINRALRDAVSDIPSVTVHDLYDAYPDFYIDKQREQDLADEHDLIVFQHPLYWYSTTPILKLWQDVVFERGFAYGKNGTALQAKDFLQVISTGGKAKAYQHEGHNHFTISEILTPMKATTQMCGLKYHDPFIVHQSYEISNESLVEHVLCYRQLLSAYVEDGSACFDKGIY